MIRLIEWFRNLPPWQARTSLFAAGAASALAMPPVNAWPLMALGFGYALLRLEAAPVRLRTQFADGWLFGAGYFAVSLHWIAFAFLVEAETYLWMMPFMLAALALGMALYWGIAAVAARLVAREGLPLALAFAASLGIAEWLRGVLFTGFPWAAPGLAADGMGAVAQAASLVGMTGLTLMIALWAMLPAVLLAHRRWRLSAMFLLALLPAFWAFGAWREMLPEPPPAAGVKVRIVQPDIPQGEKWTSENARPIFDRLMALSRTGADGSDLSGISIVVWPESALPFLVDESAEAAREIAALLGEEQSLAMGAIRRDPKGVKGASFHNSLLVFSGDGAVSAHYDKWRLVPGGEFLPFEWLLEPLGFRRVVTVPGSFAAGGGPGTGRFPGAPDAAALICYEAVFPDFLYPRGRRPGWLLNVTNDAWFGNSAGPYQHLAQARMRAIEEGLPVVRAANTGISAVIDARGRIVAKLDLGQAGQIDSPLPSALEATPYSRIGSLWLALLAAVALATAAMMTRVSSTLRK
jgi:apolipoprotein N-acyltransferase